MGFLTPGAMVLTDFPFPPFVWGPARRIFSRSSGPTGTRRVCGPNETYTSPREIVIQSRRVDISCVRSGRLYSRQLEGCRAPPARPTYTLRSPVRCRLFVYNCSPIRPGRRTLLISYRIPSILLSVHTVRCYHVLRLVVFGRRTEKASRCFFAILCV